MQKFTWPVRVYLEDTDAQAVVYNASYFRFMERARTEALRARGIDHDEARERYGVLFVLIGVEARFRAPARLADLLDVEAHIVEATGARLIFEQGIRRAEGAREPICDAWTDVACIDAARGKPRRWPADLIGKLRKP